MKLIPPYYWLYRAFSNTAKRNGQVNDLSFNDFMTFVSVKNCHYCNATIDWPERAFVKQGSRKYAQSSRAYYLDRKNNEVGYIRSNCVVCCSRCNAIKGNHLSYDEMMMLSPVLKQIVAQKIP
jgi:5-methylcytosine-specific restriction endonuclease McrA